jgi:hypothetical protein
MPERGARQGSKDAQWRTPKRSVGNGECIEVAAPGQSVLVRDSKDPGGPILSTSPKGWEIFTGKIRGGAISGTKP